jgi:gliding motility-associated-like protein
MSSCLKKLIAACVAYVLCTSVSQAQTYFLNGNATALGNDCYAVTPAINTQSGTVWYADQLNLSEPFSLEFEMYFGDNDADGADGMVFVMHTLGTNAIGQGGMGMGFEGFNPSFGIEFDTFMNSPPNSGNLSDPAYDHMAFLRNGNVNHTNANNLSGPVQVSVTSSNIEDGQNHHVRITWDPVMTTLSCYFDCDLRLSSQINLVNSIFYGDNTVTWGFTGSTGYYYNLQSVCLSSFILGSAEPDPICLGNTVTLAAAGNPTGTFIWSPTDGLSAPNEQSTDASPDETTTYTVVYTDVCGNQETTIFTVEIEDIPVIDLVEEVIVCEGENATVEATNIPADYTISWSGFGTIMSDDNASEVTVNGEGTYTIEISSPNGCVSDEQFNLIEQSPQAWPEPEAEMILCQGEIIELNYPGDWSVTWTPGFVQSSEFVITQEGNYTVEFDDNVCSELFNFMVTEVSNPAQELGPDFVVCETENMYIDAGIIVEWHTGESTSLIQVEESDEYSYEVNINGCAFGDTVFVTVDNLPVIELGADRSICEGDTLLLQIATSGTWNNGIVSSSYAITAEGLVTVTATNGTCEATDFLNVSLIPLPQVELGEDIIRCKDDDIELSANGLETLTYIWSTEEIGQNITADTTGIYTIEVSNECGSAVDSISVTIEECSEYVYIPNSFTPDNDGINDVWKPVVYNLPGYELWIYDRWGTEVFYTNDETKYWTGNIRGGEYYVEPGIYLYHFKFVVDEFDVKLQKGMVTVVR